MLFRSQPIKIAKNMKMTEQNTETVNRQMQQAWDAIDYSIDPSFNYRPLTKKK